MRAIDRQELQLFASQGAQVVEVLSRKEYDDEHLPGAISLPLRELTPARAHEQLDTGQPVIVYCWDSLCDLSPRAAWHLERLGFSPVYDYAAGKADWLAANLPSEGANAKRIRVRDAVEPVPTMAPNDSVSMARSLLRDAPIVAVVTPANVALGAVEAKTLAEAHDDQSVEEVMRPGPSTFRPDIPATELAAYFAEHHVQHALITTNDGVLVGVANRSELDRVAALERTSAPDSAGGGQTLLDVLAEFERDGYNGQFVVEADETLRCLTCNQRSAAGDVRVNALRRLEGASDPADMAAVAAIECPHCRTRATIVLKYGPDATPEEAGVLRHLTAS